MQKYYLKYKTIALMSIVLLSANLYASAWTQKKNGYYLRIYSTYLFADQEFNYQGASQDLYEEQLAYRDNYFKDISLVIYSEYGLTDNFTFVGELPFKSLTTKRTVASFYGGDEMATTSGFADLGLYGKLAILNNLTAQCEELAVYAALTGDPQAVFHAICYDPLTSAILSLAEIREMVDEMLAINRPHLPQFKHGN